MNTVQGAFGETESTFGMTGTRAGEGAEVVEATLRWGDAETGNVLGVKEVAAGGSLALGEQGDLLVPAAVLGDERVEVLRFDGDRAAVRVPAGGSLFVDGWARSEREVEVVRGHDVTVKVGAFLLRLRRTSAGTKIPLAPLEGLKRGATGVILASALAHAAAFAVIAYVSPALGATEEDPYDQDRIALMQKMLNASAQREIEDQAEKSDAVMGGEPTSGKPAEGAEGAAGKDTPNKDGHWAVRGTAKPEDAMPPRERELAAARDFGLLGILATTQSDPNSPTAAWGRPNSGADDVSAVGHLYGSNMADAMGAGGWGLNGTGEGGGGTGQGIGLTGGIGGLGLGGTCLGNGPCTGTGTGIGTGRDRLLGTHKVAAKSLRYGVPLSNGHLPAEVIQRIVRQNDGRYRFCFQQGLKTNPNLEGRVSVKFVISRDGSVAMASDAGSDIPDAGVRQCVVSSFTTLSFPAPDSGIVTVVYPIVFSPQ
jgi:hypothetical protein